MILMTVVTILRMTVLELAMMRLTMVMEVGLLVMRLDTLTALALLLQLRPFSTFGGTLQHWGQQYVCPFPRDFHERVAMVAIVSTWHRIADERIAGSSPARTTTCGTWG